MSFVDERRNLGIDIALLRQLGNGDPKNLPRVFVHDNAVWHTKGGAIAVAKIDGKGNLHMAEADFLVLKTLLPVSQVARVRQDVVEFKFDVLPHHLLGGHRDARPVQSLDARKALTRGGLGHDPFGRRRKVKIHGGLH